MKQLIRIVLIGVAVVLFASCNSGPSEAEIQERIDGAVEDVLSQPTTIAQNLTTTTTTTVASTTTTVASTTTAPVVFDWTTISFEDIVGWEQKINRMPSGSFESLNSCEGAYLGISAMAQALVGEIVALADLTTGSINGTVEGSETAAAWTEWSDAAALPLVLSELPTSHPAYEHSVKIEDDYKSVYLTAGLIALAFDPDTGAVDETILDLWVPSFLEAAEDLRDATAHIYIPGQAESLCP